MKRTRIVGTIGPVSANPEIFRSLVEAGLNLVRLNGAHGTTEWHSRTIEMVRSIDPSIPILLDLPGRKVRTLKNMPDFRFEKGSKVTLSTDINNPTSGKILVNYPDLHKDLKVGNTILADDGQFSFLVSEIDGSNIICTAQNSGVLKSSKGINVPYVKLNTPKVTDRDHELIRFAKEQKIDFVGVSFVESREHVQEIYENLRGSTIEVISKVENQFAVENIEGILDASFGIMIDRGDLGAETSIYDLPILQKEIIKKANSRGKPVIVATEMLHHMINNPFPTKAEINDISNAVLDGCSAVMLSGETAVGTYAVEAVQTMTRTILNAESFQNLHDNMHKFIVDGQEPPHAIAKSVAMICKELPITKVICVSFSGYAAQLISRYHLAQPIFVATDSAEKARKFSLYKGTQSFGLDIKFDPSHTEHIGQALHLLYKGGHIEDQDLVVVVAVKYPRNNFMNSIEIQKIENLKHIFKW